MIELPNVTLFQVGDAEDSRIEICAKEIRFAEHILLGKRSSYAEYNRFIIEDLHKLIETDFVLTIQHDGFIVNPSAWTDEFFAYDYIGAVIWNNEVGCGGFSLRSKRFLELSSKLDYNNRDMHLLIKRRIRWKDVPNEDFFLCIEKRAELVAQGMKFAPIEVADRFAWDISIGRQPEYTGAFGFHSPRSLEYLMGEGIV